jgi:hypothetical protein
MGVLRRIGRNRRYSLVAVGLLLVIGCWWANQVTGPRYYGRGPGYWLGQIQYGNGTPRETVLLAFLTIGERVVPAK